MKLALVCLIVLIALFTVEARLGLRQESAAPSASASMPGAAGAPSPSAAESPAGSPSGSGAPGANAAGRVEGSFAGAAIVAALAGLFI